MTAGRRDRHHAVKISLLSDARDGNDRAPHVGKSAYERDKFELSMTVFPILTTLVQEERERIFTILCQ